MPKLDKKTAKVVDETEAGGFPLVPEGTCLGRLRTVEVKDVGPSGYAGWNWEFDAFDLNDGLPDEDSAAIGRLWAYTSLSPAAAFKMAEMFQAFDVPADTDTDLLCGQVIKLRVAHEVIEKGKRKGEIGSNPVNYMPLGDLALDDDIELGGGDDETL